jgi:hypothetical protein
MTEPNKLQPEDFYLLPDGRMVFTREYHLKRGYCCKSNCKHCPYGFQESEEKEKAKKK